MRGTQKQIDYATKIVANWANSNRDPSIVARASAIEDAGWIIDNNDSPERGLAFLFAADEIEAVETCAAAIQSDWYPSKEINRTYSAVTNWPRPFDDEVHEQQVVLSHADCVFPRHTPEFCAAIMTLYRKFKQFR